MPWHGAVLERARTLGVAGPLVGAVTLLVAFDSGGYYPASWNVYTLGLSWAILLALILRRRIDPGRSESTMLAALAALTAWGLASYLWAPSPQSPLLDAQRTILYVVFVAAVVAVARIGAEVRILVAAAVAAFGVSAYALLSRLRPDVFGFHDDPVAKGRLYQPLGYWNALGIFVTMTSLLVLGCVMRARRQWVRAVAAAALPPLATTVYFTYSRGSILAGIGAFAVTLALDARRLRSFTAALVTLPWIAISVADATTRGALDRTGAGVAKASAAGGPLLAIILACSVAAAASVVAFDRAEGRVTISDRMRRGYVAALAAVAVAALGVTFVSFGGPQKIVVHAVEDLGSRPIVTRGSQNARLLSLSLNGRPALWQAAVSDFRAHPVAGSGAGTFEQYWLQHRHRVYVSRYAHSLYLESLAEGGIVRLAILLAVIGVPLAAAVRMRGQPVVLTALGAFAAYVIHTGFDWDWEMPAVTILALACASAILVAARRSAPAAWRLPYARVAAGAACVAVAVAAAVCWRGNDAVTRSVDAQGGNWSAAAADARTAISWQPWSDSGNLALAAVLVHDGDRSDAARTLRQATRRNPADWSAWQQLADVTTGAEHRDALARAQELNPKGMHRLLRARYRPAHGLKPH